jgi:hypothetical protein
VEYLKGKYHSVDQVIDKRNRLLGYGLYSFGSELVYYWAVVSMVMNILVPYGRAVE